MIEIRVLRPDDWPTWRALRLAALADAPLAFSARLSDWQGAHDRPERWRARLQIPGSHNVIAVLDGEPAGMASGVPGAADGVIELISMWISPAARGRGAGDRLMQAVTDWAAGIGAAEVRLEVAQDNEQAIALYERNGFAIVGEADSVIPGAARDYLMARTLLVR